MNDKYMLGIDELLKKMVHRYPFLMIDRILEMEKGKTIKALKNVTINEPFFQGHFPGKPVMPGVMITEAMAQAGVVLLYFSLEDRKNDFFYLGGMDNVRFRKAVKPGDQLIIEMKLVKQRSMVCVVKGKCFVDGSVAVEGEFLAVAEKGK